MFNFFLTIIVLSLHKMKNILKSLNKSQNVNEMQMLIESVYKGPSPEIFNKALYYHIRYVLKNDIEETRRFILSIIDRLEDLPFNKIFKHVKEKKI